MTIRDPKDLRCFGADFDYTDRSSIMLEAGRKPYAMLHHQAESRIKLEGSSVQNELAIRESAIDFLRGQLDAIGGAALAYVTGIRLMQLMDKLGEVPEEVKGEIAKLFHNLETLVGSPLPSDEDQTH